MTSRNTRAIFGITATLTALVLSGCASPQPDASETAKPATIEFAPVVTADDTTTEIVPIEVANGTISFTIPSPVVTITGVEPEIADTFVAAVDARHDAVVDRANGFAGIIVDDCDEGCEREAGLTVAHAGVYEEYGTVASSSGWMFGSRDRNMLVHSVTMNLKTGAEATLTDFLDLDDAAVAARAEAAVRQSENGASCDAATHLGAIDGFAPTDDGVLLLWEVDQTQTAQCGVSTALVPWEDGAVGETVDVADPNSPDGTWCATDDSMNPGKCFTVAGDTVTWAHGSTEPINIFPGDHGASLNLSGQGAPIGAFYPAGAPLTAPGSPADHPDEARLYNGQTGDLYLRQ